LIGREVYVRHGNHERELCAAVVLPAAVQQGGPLHQQLVVNGSWSVPAGHLYPSVQGGGSAVVVGAWLPRRVGALSCWWLPLAFELQHWRLLLPVDHSNNQ
jgi:hypothetical protein